MTYYVSNVTLNPTHSLTHSPFKGQSCQLVTLGHPGLTYIFNF